MKHLSFDLCLFVVYNISLSRASMFITTRSVANLSLMHAMSNFMIYGPVLLIILTRILQWGEDRRFDEMRANLGKLAIFWIFQV